jgi:hypothetical protein
LDHEPGSHDLDDFVGPFLVASLLDEFVDGERSPLCVFPVFDVLSKVLKCVAMDATFYDQVKYRG